MCGIWGYVGTDTGIPVQDAWDGLCNLDDRGPDDWGLYTDTTGKIVDEDAVGESDCSVALGNRRLSILDLSAAGNQPMTVNGRYWLIYNGEVYNYRELRDDLREKGYAFDSDSDTEVVLCAYREYGADCVELFRGMFAFAIWDTATDRLFAARDRFGIKPFYYDATGSGIAFASEITSLLAGSVTDPVVDPVAIDGFLALGSVPAPKTILRDVCSLPPGTTLEFDQSTGDREIRRYWQPTFGSTAMDGEERPTRGSTGVSDRVRELFLDSIELRMRSDVPVGAFLSGGLDSSAIVAGITDRRESETPLHTFSIDFDDSDYSEGSFAREVAAEFGTEHHSRTVSAEDVRDQLPEIIEQMDQPTVDGVNTFFVSQLAAQANLSVALSGLGSDELFYGYPTFDRVPILARAARVANRLPDGIQTILAKAFDVADGVAPTTYAGHLADVLRSSAPFGSAYAAARGLFTRSQRRKLLADESVTDWGNEINIEIENTLSDATLSEAVSHTELTWYMHNQLLRDTDAMSMGHSLEVRVPFLDAELADFVMSTPAAAKQEGEKGVLKDAVADAVPSVVLDRKKTGFTFPFENWLSGELAPVVDDALSERRLSKTQIERAGAEDIRQRFENGDVHWSRLWALVVLSLWIDTHITNHKRASS
ncbi:asparagine synthase (glutamine-hydrolyzing) [Halopenitus persicus]|uniref:Putative asparagine synthetase [glutamine-hydrolyzing] n=1 Tax=Halopenitus persicus TaxID=1048396 RepID=A0A1H3IZC9_9EURY|nr:asparagine synthase (glutamine-hydrolyzing) [Halopenitus persicus]SDY33080.1 asparagine synthase (glutamine-hydrolysing) [Halopenitus persicus]